MAREIEITVSSDKTNEIVADLNKLEGLLNMQVLKGASVNPPGDVISVIVATRSLQVCMRLLDRHGLGTSSGPSITTSEPDSIVNPDYARLIDRDWVQATWEEMESLISRESNGNTILLLLMVASGMLAAVGIATNALHLVIGGMLVAPGFMPLMRITLGLVTNCSTAWKKGFADLFLFYFVLIVSAGLTSLVIQALGTDPLSGKVDYYQLTQSLSSYWSSTTPLAVMASAAASLAGVILIATKRSAFTSGVMIGLALVPSASLMGIGLAAGDMELVGKAAVRWLTDVGLILVISFVFFFILKAVQHKRSMAI